MNSFFFLIDDTYAFLVGRSRELSAVIASWSYRDDKEERKRGLVAVEISIILAIRFWPRALGERMMREKRRTGEATRAGQGWHKIFARGSLSSPVPQQNANGRIVLCGGTLFRRGEGKRASFEISKCRWCSFDRLSRPTIVSGFVSRYRGHDLMLRAFLRASARQRFRVPGRNDIYHLIHRVESYTWFRKSRLPRKKPLDVLFTTNFLLGSHSIFPQR